MAIVLRVLEILPDGDEKQPLWRDEAGMVWSTPEEGNEQFFVRRATGGAYCSTKCPHREVRGPVNWCAAFSARLGKVGQPVPVCLKCAKARMGGETSR
jgi:hypothetical protein